jgi:glycosyltransferase involved in cell wall biosynthesis
MMVTFVSSEGIEPWDWRCPDTTGLGGSETCIVELARRLTERGHDVRVYCPCFSDTTDQVLPSGRVVRYRPITDDIDVEESGSWFLCRAPRLIDHFQLRPDQRLYLRCDDMHHGGELTLERAAKLAGIVCQSPFHREYLLGAYPFLRPDHVHWPGCGIDVERMEKLDLPGRDPFGLIWASSYDRGLDHAIAILQQARRYEPRLHLEVYYGWEGYDRVMARCPGHPLAGFKARVLAMDLTNVTFHGRVAKETLWRALAGSNIQLYSTAFEETGAVAIMEGQALGAIPITAPLAALRDSTLGGYFIKGHPADPMIQGSYMEAVLNVAHSNFDRWRPQMMERTRRLFGWNHAVDLHARLIGEPHWFQSEPNLGQTSVSNIRNGQVSEKEENARDLATIVSGVSLRGNSWLGAGKDIQDDPRAVLWQGDR